MTISGAPRKSLDGRSESTLDELENAVKFLKVENRLNTFRKWIYKDTDPCNKSKLAEAGFIFVGEKNYEDLVKCFFCQKELDGWEVTDDPWDEHVKHSSNCQFIQLQKPSTEMSVEQLLTLKAELQNMYLRKFYSGIQQSCMEMYAKPKGNTKKRNRK